MTDYRAQFSQPSYSPSMSYTSLDVRENFKVMVRVRPPLAREIDPTYGFASVINVSQDHKRVSIMEYLGAAANDLEREQDVNENPGLASLHHFTFDYVYDQDSTQTEVYDLTAKPAVLSVLEGYNATLLAYGQTGTGKTYTMEGFKYNSTDPQRGIVPRSIEDIFKYIESSQNANSTFMVRGSYLQIYNENLSDLLKIDRGTLQIREDKERGVFVEGLSEWAVRSPAEICSLMQKGESFRATACTKMNDVSSRSHAVFIIIVEQMSSVYEGEEDLGRQIKVGKLNIVDLAGSERVRVTGATGKRLEESKKINQSLSALGNVISALTDKRLRSHIPYRDSKLTRLLEDSLGGNCKTTMMAMISPAFEAFLESLSSLKFANRAKNIRNEARINEDVDQRTLLRKYETELRKLRQELEAKNKSVIDMQRLLELGESRRLAEADDEFTVLEKRSQDYLSEKEQKKRLEDKIKMMNSQLLIGGKKIEDTPQFRNALEAKQKAIRQEYESKLQEIEQERQQIEEDKAQIDRYKQLLLRQRDIMIALTSRLNERDETIIQLQEELDAYDRLQRETEEGLEYKASRCEQLTSILRRHNLAVPSEDVPETRLVTLEPKRYPPYSTDSVTLDEDSYVPLQLLTAEEKITELSYIIDSQKGELDRLVKEVSGFRHQESVRPVRAELTSKDRESLKGVLESSLMRKGYAGPLTNMVTQVQKGTYDFLNLSSDVQGLLKNVSLSLTVLRESTDSAKETGRTATSEGPKENSLTRSFINEEIKASGRRPLTVDEMLAQKRREGARKRDSEAV
jgi:kinesin family protein 3/17